MTRIRWTPAVHVLHALVVILTISTTRSSADDRLAGRTIREVRIHGLVHTDDDVVRRELTARVGERLTTAALARDHARLEQLRIFSAIDIRAREIDDANVAVDVTLEETFPNIPYISMQFNEENGFSAGPGFRSINFRGRAVELGAAAQFGGATNIEFLMRDPWVYGDHGSYTFQYFRRERQNELDDFGEVAHEPSVRVQNYIGYGGRIGGLVSATSIASDRDGITLTDDNEDTIVRYGGFLGIDTRDVWTRPSTGWWSELEVSRSSVLDIDSGFWSFQLDARRYQTWNERHSVILSSLTTLRTGKLGVDIPLHQDFHIGGTNTVRGFDLSSRTGIHQTINTAEYRYLLLPPRSLKVWFFTGYFGLSIAGFTDVGHAWTDRSELSFDNVLDSYGVGVRFLIPFVDEVRFDMAWGEPGQGMRFHFGVYPKVEMQRARVR